MKYIKTFETTYKLFENGINDKYHKKFTHELISIVGNDIEKKANLKKGENGYQKWYTDNWCFKQDLKQDFYCNYYFYFFKGSPEIKKLKNYLSNNNIHYSRETNQITGINLRFDYTDQILNKVIKDENPNFTDEDVKNEIEIINSVYKYNL